MTDVQRGIIRLIHSALTGEAKVLPAAFSMEEAMPVIRDHRIIALAYDGAVRCGIDKNLPCMQELFKEYCRALYVNMRQMDLFKKVTGALEAAGIDHMPIKGCLLKSLYPKPELRCMGDVDVLIRTEQKERIDQTMADLGFEEGVESDHELHWTKSGVLVELHKRLIPSYNKDYYAYYGDGWRLAVPTQQPHRFCLSNEDEFVYIFVHFAKHYRDSGIGCRHVTDLWVYREKHPDLDEGKILAALKELQLEVFYRNVMRTLENWFGNGPEDEITDLITDTIFQSGVYGKSANTKLSSGVKLSKVTGRSKDAGWISFLKATFLPLSGMKQKYPVLEKAPFLLPVFWLVRIVQTLFVHQDHLKTVYNSSKALSADAIDTYQASLNRVGLDYNFK